MKFTVNTEILQNMVSKVIRCSSNNKLIPITSLMSIKVADGIFTLTTTDATNYFYVQSKDKVDCENFEVSVIADTFTKLIQKTTTKTVSLDIEDGVLQVTGNGDYKLELPLDENGSVIKFPNKLPDSEPTPVNVINKSSIEKMLNYNKASLAVGVEIPALCHYYCGESIITSDVTTMCKTDIKMFDKPLLLTAQMVELLGVMTDDKVNVWYSDSEILLWDSTSTIYAPLTEGVETYPADTLLGHIATEMESSCKVSREAVVNLLDRLSLFVSSYDKKWVYVTFTDKGIVFSSKTSSGTELVPYISSENFKAFTSGIDIEVLKGILSTQTGEALEMSYGSDLFIKLTAGNVTQLVAWADDEEDAYGEE